MEELKYDQLYVLNSGKIWKYVDHNAMKITSGDLDNIKA